MIRAASVPIPKFRKPLQHTAVRTSESYTNTDTAIHVMLDNFQRGGFRAGMMGGGLRGGIVGEASVRRWSQGASAASVCVVGSSTSAAPRCAQDLRHPLLVSASPSRRYHSRSGLVSMAAPVGLGKQFPGAGGGFGPVTATTGTHRHY
jgi:hypothetical protein